MITCSCGCVNAIDEDSGVQRCLSKCRFHVDELAGQPGGLDYYRQHGTVTADGLPSVAVHVAQLVDALGPIPRAPAGDGLDPLAVEVGGGASPYVWALREAGYRYLGIEPDPWAAAWVRDTYGVDVLQARFPGCLAPRLADLVLCAHALEHMPDAPGAFAALVAMTKPGGRLIVVVPNDDDPANPDHWWFFTEETLTRMARRNGLEGVRVATRKHIERERFLYLTATKAGA